MNCSKIIVKTKNKLYPIIIGDQILHSVGTLIKKRMPLVEKISVIADNKIPYKTVKELSKSLKKYKIKIYKIGVKEKIKNFSFAQRLVENLLRDNIKRSDCVIALGGGVVGDLAGFVASITKRGVRFINIPSTLLAQVDSSIGGKTGINSNYGKNLIGTFSQPDFVLTDISILKSLPKREIICGYGEILKHALVSNKKFFLWLNKNANKIIDDRNKKLLELAVIKSCKIKSEIVSKDENEKNLRKILNFGHTFAHGFEGTKKFSKKLNHGEAVLLGMITACQLAYDKKLLNKNNLDLIKKHYLNLNFPISIKKIFKKKEVNTIINYMQRDKKNFNKKINLILIKGIGNVIKPNAINLSSHEIKKFLIKNFI